MRPAAALILASAFFAMVPGPPATRAGSPALALVLQGKVEDRETHKPIGGATVRVRRIVVGSASRAGREYPAETTLKADAGGRIKVVFPSRGVADPRVHVAFEVSHPGYAAQSSPPVSLAQLDFNRRQGDRPSLGVIKLERGLEYKGLVLTPDGKPAANVPFEFSVGTEAELADEIYFLPSRVRGRTDPDGGIRFRAASTDTVHLRLTPEHWAPSHVSWGMMDQRDPGYKTWKRQELGRRTLEPGVVVTGRLLDLKGRPLPHQKVAAAGGAVDIGRTAETDADGRFAFDPLPPGKYIVVGEKQYPSFWNPEYPAPSPTDAVIKPVRVDTRAGPPPCPVELHEVESVTLVVHHVDSQGRPVRGYPIQLGGQFPDPIEDGEPEERGQTDLPADVFSPLAEGAAQDPDQAAIDLVWAIQGPAGPDGTVEVRVPRGLEASLEFANLPSRASYRIKLSRDGPLEAEFDGELGVLDQDRREIVVVWCEAPVVVATIRTHEGKLPENASVVITLNVNGNDTEWGIEKLPDGRFRSLRLLPDLEYSARAVAEGYEGPAVKFTLPEGAVKEITLELKGQPASKKEDDP